MPLPLPEFVFGSLLERWNLYAPLSLPIETRRFAAECLAIAACRIDARGLLLAGGRPTAFTGTVRYAVLRRDPYWLGALATLAAFAPWCGIGIKTSMGMGQIRLDLLGRATVPAAPAAKSGPPP